jgi:hypothetical protein
MNKLFHEVAIEPEAILRSDALTLLRELRLDHSRYIQALPEDLFIEMVAIIKNHPDPTQHKKLAMLEAIRSSIISTRKKNIIERSKARNWRELVSIEGKAEPFDLLVGQSEIIYRSDNKDLELYLFESDGELGSVTKAFRDPDDWLQIIRPLIMSDNSLVIVDRYFDPSHNYYSRLFSNLAGWLRQTRICQVRIFIGPPTSKPNENSFTLTHFENVCDELYNIIVSEHSDFRGSLIVTYRTDLHLRYIGTKTCALELDYGFRLSGAKTYKVSVMRAAGIKDFKSQFFSELSSTNVLGNKVVWPN